MDPNKGTLIDNVFRENDLLKENKTKTTKVYYFLTKVLFEKL